MWNSFTTDSHVSVTAEITTFKGGNGDEIHAYVAHPIDDYRRGGIVLIHHMPGWDEFYEEFAERLARHGYDVICPDLYCRVGHGTSDDVTAKVRAQGGIADDSVVADCAAALDYLKALPTSNGKVGVMGTCSGGRHSLLVASLVPGFTAVIDLWGGNVIMAEDQLTPQRPVPVIDYTEKLTIPLLGLFGNDDKSPAPEQVDQHEAELKRLNKDYEFHRYDGAGHGFMYYQNQMYRQEQAMDATEKVFAFWAKQLAN
ncbi:MAG TPA: dienelactone hydrolase family protein [Acidimicrobiales bacterium]|nr:dienelactone hydrolase family protein [Acidimicrobiales bacterium]